MTVRDFIGTVAEYVTVRVEGLRDFDYEVLAVHDGRRIIPEEFLDRKVLWVFADWDAKAIVLQI